MTKLADKNQVRCPARIRRRPAEAGMLARRCFRGVIVRENTSDRRSDSTHIIGLLAVAIIWIGQPARAQEVPFRVSLVTPEVVCHVAPSHSANVAEVLKVTGGGRTREIVARQTETDERGETWIHVAAGHTGRPWVREGCWVAESMVVSTAGAGHLLELADRLLSADGLPPFEHLLAVYNLFVHPAYREQVERSPVFGQRRAGLMAKAVEAAQWPGLIGVRPVDRDPRIIVWIESLGDRVRYSESPSGWGTWTVNAETPEVEEGLAGSTQGEQAPPPEGRELAIIAPDVACRIRPSRSASGPRALRLDLHFRTDRADTIAAGEAWVFYPPGDCWVAASHTAPGLTDEHVLTIVDRFLTSGEGWSIHNQLGLLTVLSGRGRGHLDAVEGSAALGLRRLELVRRVLGEYGTRSADAVTLAWIEALGNEIAYTGEGSAWTVSDEAYLTLYERHRPDPFAEEIMWKYASESDAYSCEGTVSCSVEEAVNKRLARYWTDFPDGRHIARAIGLARTELGYVLEQCTAAHAAGPDSRQARVWRSAQWDTRGPEIVRALLGSLEQVSDEDKAPLIEVLGELEECAAWENAAGPGDATTHHAARLESLDPAERDPPVGAGLCPARPSAGQRSGRTGAEFPVAAPRPSPRRPGARKPMGSKGGGAAPCQAAMFNVASAGSQSLAHNH